MTVVLNVFVNYVWLWVLCFGNACFIKFYVCCVCLCCRLGFVDGVMLRFVALDTFALVLLTLFDLLVLSCVLIL